MAELYSEIHFCLRCGNSLEIADKFGKLRPFCPICSWVYFADPKVAVAALIEKDGDILLVRRANVPQSGLWTLPAGFVDAGEDPVHAVERECLEETGLITRVIDLFDVLYGQEHERGAHILIVYRVQLISGDLVPGDDVDEAAFFSPTDPPPLAFSTTRKILESLGTI